MRQLITASQIDDWFQSTKRDAQELLPHLVRRLIVSTVPSDSLKQLRIPIGDQIGLPDYDGRVVVVGDHRFVPNGSSVWEMGTGEFPDKATDDFSRRTAKPGGVTPSDTVFVFVTPHVARNKENWAKARRGERIWKDVQVVDAVDLDSWLETAPRVAKWLASQMGIPVEGMRDLEQFISEEFVARYRIKWMPELVVGGRNEALDKLHQWLNSDAREFTVEGESVEEAAAFIAAAIQLLAVDAARSIESRLLFVDRPEAVAYMTTATSVHFVVPLTPEVRRRVIGTASSLLRVIVPSVSTVGHESRVQNSARLGRIRRAACESALSKMEISPQRIDRIASEFKGSLTASLWMISPVEDGSLPWTTGDAALELAPLMLAGQWLDSSERDKECIQRLSGRPYAEIEKLLARWSGSKGPLVRRGVVWDWLAWDFAFDCLAKWISSERIERFLSVAKEVLATLDPSVELPADDRWKANIFGKIHPYSTAPAHRPDRFDCPSRSFH